MTKEMMPHLLRTIPMFNQPQRNLRHLAGLLFALAIGMVESSEEGVWFTASPNTTEHTPPPFDAQARLDTCRELVRPSAPSPDLIIQWKDPLYVIWFPPSSNSSFEHEWIEDTVLAKVQRWLYHFA
jgi:hypothetical protein